MMQSIIDQIIGEMHLQYEDGVMKAVQECGFNVNKERLLQALTDARAFYDEGFSDGLREQHKWIPVTEQEEPTENGTYLCHGYWFGSRRKLTETAHFFGEWNIANNFVLTHWMPLPEPPREGE